MDSIINLYGCDNSGYSSHLFAPKAPQLCQRLFECRPRENDVLCDAVLDSPAHFDLARCYGIRLSVRYIHTDVACRVCCDQYYQFYSRLTGCYRTI
ncbi:hypothetical protein D3C73_1383190 [compost metagenome]